MQFEEWKILVKGMKSSYTSEKFLPDADSVKVWFTFVEEQDTRVMTAAVKKYIATNKFPPTISDILGLCQEVTQGTLPDSGEAWMKVMNAVSKYGYMQTERAMASFDELTQRAVKYIGGFEYICNSPNNMADRANFFKCYDRLIERKNAELALPESLRKSIKQLQIGKEKTQCLELKDGSSD